MKFAHFVIIPLKDFGNQKPRTTVVQTFLKWLSVLMWFSNTARKFKNMFKQKAQSLGCCRHFCSVSEFKKNSKIIFSSVCEDRNLHIFLV